jgi:hypothetical protein
MSEHLAAGGSVLFSTLERIHTRAEPPHHLFDGETVHKRRKERRFEDFSRFVVISSGAYM